MCSLSDCLIKTNKYFLINPTVACAYKKKHE